jgi:Helix-turn-helix domain
LQFVPPHRLELAQRLRQLRQQMWPDVRITQEALAKALGGVAAATISSWESPTAPKLPPRDRVLAYARFFATRRSVETGAEFKTFPLDALTEEERIACGELAAELLGLRDAAGKPTEAVAVRRSWHFLDEGPVTLVCAQLPKIEQSPSADPADPNYTELLSFADLDALMELFGHIRAENPSMGVYFKSAANVVPDDLSGHVILLGDVTWNTAGRRLSELTSLPVKQVADPSMASDDPFVAEVAGKDKRFLPVWGGPERTVLVEDVGLIARVPNPFNSSRTFTICNGIHSRGIFGAVRSLTDARLRDSNEEYISTHFAGSESFLILMKVTVIEGRVMTPDFTNPGCVLYQWAGGSGQ